MFPPGTVILAQQPDGLTSAFVSVELAFREIGFASFGNLMRAYFLEI
jgi:hypothetical protein